jgi:hypothetical protein
MSGGQEPAAVNSMLSDTRSGARPLRVVPEMLLAALCGPLLALVALIVILGNVDEWDIHQRQYGFLMPLMIPGAVAVSAAIFLDCRAVQRLSNVAAADVRTVLSAITIGSLGLLSVWVTSQAGSVNRDEAGGIVIFLCLPTLLICASLLWYAARAIRQALPRALLLLAFIVATIGTEWRCEFGLRGSAEENLFMLHSMLVALAFALSLCAWGDRTFSRREQRTSHERLL